MTSKIVTDATFEQDVLRAQEPVLVDFWAEWCGPCRIISPALEEIAHELGDRVTVAKVNVDDSPEAPARYGVRSIPALILFKGGQPTATRIGAASKSALSEWIETIL